MLQCRKDSRGIVELTLSQIALFLATAILLTVVFFFVFSNDWQRTAELQSIASNFSNLLEDLINNFFEHTILFQFPEKSYPYFVAISTEYIILSARGSWNSNLLITRRFLSRPWLRLPPKNWTTGDDLHVYLNKTCGHHGTENDPIPLQYFVSLLNEYNSTISYFAMQPCEIIMRQPVFVEKVSIYYNFNRKHDFLLVYQLI